MVSLKAGHQRCWTLGIRSSSLLLLSSNISKCPLAGLHHCPTVCSPGGLYFPTDYDGGFDHYDDGFGHYNNGFDHYDDGRNNLQHSVTTIFMSRCSSSLATATPSTRSAWRRSHNEYELWNIWYLCTISYGMVCRWDKHFPKNISIAGGAKYYPIQESKGGLNNSFNAFFDTF